MRAVKRGERIGITRNVTTSGSYLGGEGVGYYWEPCEAPGDFSGETRGRIQGHREPALVEMLTDGHLELSQAEELLLYVRGEKIGLTVLDAFVAGAAQIVSGGNDGGNIAGGGER
jgi:hypothetical protein